MIAKRLFSAVDDEFEGSAMLLSMRANMSILKFADEEGWIEEKDIVTAPATARQGRGDGASSLIADYERSRIVVVKPDRVGGCKTQPTLGTSMDPLGKVISALKEQEIDLRHRIMMEDWTRCNRLQAELENSRHL